MSDVHELSERLVLELDSRIAALDDPTGSAPDTGDDPDQMRRELTVDRALAAAHSRYADEIISADDSTLCRECHEPRPCTTSIALAHKYAMPKQLAGTTAG